MEEKQCPTCKMKIDREAKVCPYCRKTLGITWPIKILIALGVLWIIGNITSHSDNHNPDLVSSTPVIITETNIDTDHYHGIYPKTWRISGTIKNVSGKTASYARVKAKIYSEQGEFLGVEEKFCDPIDINPGQEATFAIIFVPAPNASPNKTKFGVSCN